MGYPFLGYTLLFVKKSLGTAEERLLRSLLIERREALSLRQIELAHRLGVPQSFVSKYENGERRLDILELRQICLAMEMSLGEFVSKLESVISEKES